MRCCLCANGYKTFTTSLRKHEELHVRTRKRLKLIFLAPLAILGIVLIATIGGVIVQQLWNWLVPALIGWHQITFWQALGMLLLCRILFGGHGGGFARSRARQRWADRWEAMTPEEREQFRQRMKERCGFGPPTAESKGSE